MDGQNKQVSLVKREGFGSPFFYLFSVLLCCGSQVLKKQSSQTHFVFLSSFLELQKCHRLLQKCHSQMFLLHNRYIINEYQNQVFCLTVS